MRRCRFSADFLPHPVATWQHCKGDEVRKGRPSNNGDTTVGPDKHHVPLDGVGMTLNMNLIPAQELYEKVMNLCS